MDTGTIASIAGAVVLVIGAIVAGILQIIGKLNELKTKTEATAVAVDGRMSAVEAAAKDMMAAFKEQVLKAQGEATAARGKQDEISATALADANERARIATAVTSATQQPAPKPIVDANGRDVHPTAIVEVTKGTDVREGMVELRPKPPAKGKP